MQLNVSTCYAIQMLLYLTRNQKTVSSTELSENLAISQRYILQIAGKLRDGGLVNVQAGMSGGYCLRKEASTISAYDVITLMEGDMSIPHCVKPCKNANLHNALSILKNYLDTYFQSITFDKLADKEMRGQLSEIIAMVGDHIIDIKTNS